MSFKKFYHPNPENEDILYIQLHTCQRKSSLAILTLPSMFHCTLLHKAWPSLPCFQSLGQSQYSQTYPGC